MTSNSFVPKHKPVLFGSINDRLKFRWDSLLKILAEQSEDFWVDLALGAFRKKQYDDALVNVYQALAMNPRNGAALKLKGMTLQFKAYQANHVDQHDAQIRAMLDAYQQAVEVDPAMGESIERRLKYLYFYEFNRGVRAYDQGQREATHEDAFRTAWVHFELAALIRQHLTVDLPEPDTPWDAFVNQALALLNAGRPEEATHALEAAIAQGDTSPNTCLLLADLYEQQGFYEKAALLLEQAWQDRYADRSFLEANLLNAYIRAGKIERAIPIYQRAVMREPDNAALRYNYGSLLLSQEAFDKAIEHLQAAAALAPDAIDAHYNLGAAFFNKAVHLHASETASGDQGEAAKALLQQAAGPLEKARHLTEARGDDATDIYQTLFLIYERTDQLDKADRLTARLEQSIDDLMLDALP